MKMVISVKFWIFISVNMYVLRGVCCSDRETGGDSMRCSVFDFEQKLLEKLVRMEMKMETMEMKMDTMELKMDSTEMKLDTLEMKVNTTEMKMEKMDREITSFQQSSEIEMTSLTKDVLRLKNAVLPVVFEASGVTKESGLKNQILKFNKHVSINTGNGYNKETGKFNAPSAGTYVFELQLCIESKKRVVAAITVDESPIKMIDFRNDGSSYTCISGSGLSAMGSGSEAFVKCNSQTDDGDVLHNHEKYTSFSGRKLF